ncbi:MAG: Membrane-bound dehydrogenase domain protein [Limisphaerales bacterium]|nr:MAG: Membrane-bound dehydrogenase domain protein [Limisphaerales bacterium]KAG0509893.1 MAG: membrane-bound dehydrogenase [Limisphaerales bacterium]TXT50636.1 MAG: Membrane-bound dehydrogenase domain protein [Limisphaerales bacterium]
MLARVNTVKSLRLLIFASVCAAVASAHGAAPPAATGLAAIRVPEGFQVELAAGPDLAPYAMFGALDERGRLFLAESSGKNIRGLAMSQAPECRIRRVEDTDGDGVFDQSTIFVDRVGIPMGVLWHDGALFVASPPELLRFDDVDGDGRADSRTVLLSGWNVRGTASLHGPFLGPDGWLYLTDGRHGFDIKTKEGTNLKGLASRIWRVRPDGTQLHSFAGGGFDNPIEVVWTSAGEMVGTMTYFVNPQHGQRDALMHFLHGGVYSKWHESIAEFKLTGDLMGPMTKFARIAPAGLMRYRGTSFGPEFRGNLFSAQFNPHRVQRHVVARHGATFTTEDSDFLVSSDPDFHPCDVLEDADGSLLVVDTGGWYVDQCPLSRISKPEFKGGIYRVRRADAPKVNDPRGVALNWKQLAPVALVKLLEDPRPFVVDRAVEALVKKGEAAVAPLAELRRKSFNSDARCAAVWCLFRIGAVKAQAEIRAALADVVPDVRIAAAQAAGLAGDPEALDALHAMLRQDQPPVRREAATALGRIGDKRSNGLLVTAAARAADRFEEHALTYALIQNFSRLTNQNAGAASAQLPNLHPRSARTALIAFDQMDGSRLVMEHVAPLLRSRDAALRRAALWVFSRHADWAPGVRDYLKSRLKADKWEPGEEELLRETLLNFAADAGLQGILAVALNTPETKEERRLFLLDVLERSPVKKFPEQWNQVLRALLEGQGNALRLRALAVLRARGLAEFDGQLRRLAAAPTEPKPVRLAAIGVLASRTIPLATNHFDFLVESAGGKDYAARSSAAQVLGRAKLSDAQQAKLAESLLPAADSVTLLALVEAHRGGKGEAAGRAFVAALERNKAAADVLSATLLGELLASHPESVRAAAKPLLGRIEARQAERIRRLAELEPLLSGGDVGRGRAVFYGQKSQCSACHAIGREGGALGPDLTSIGAIRSGRDILEAIVFPSASFVPGYEPMRVETKDDVITGNIVREDSSAVVVKLNAALEQRIPRGDIKSITPGAVSVMAEGLTAGLTKDELLDLLAFLQAQNGEQWLLPQRRGK